MTYEERVSSEQVEVLYKGGEIDGVILFELRDKVEYNASCLSMRLYMYTLCWRWKGFVSMFGGAFFVAAVEVDIGIVIEFKRVMRGL